jgi:hypothetical protein
LQGGLNVTLPPNENLAPIGYYMLFLVNNQGVPSVAEWVRATPNIVLAGDSNDDGTVDAADCVVWRKNPGGIYTPGDYDTWRTHFGEVVGGGSGASADASVPEPASLVLLMFAAAGWCFQRRGRSNANLSSKSGSKRLGLVRLLGQT